MRQAKEKMAQPSEDSWAKLITVRSAFGRMKLAERYSQFDNLAK
jgi:hypothetical protein